MRLWPPPPPKVLTPRGASNRKGHCERCSPGSRWVTIETTVDGRSLGNRNLVGDGMFAGNAAYSLSRVFASPVCPFGPDLRLSRCWGP